MDKPLTQNIGRDKPPADFAIYEQSGGYQAVRETVGKREPGDVIDIVKEANLRGRGGGGFPAGLKWSFVSPEPTPGHVYLVANADEMEPGTFKDRLLMERDPHQLLEGMILAGYSTRADIGYIFIRSDYYLAQERLRGALTEARAKGYLGEDILGTGYSFDIYVHVSAGRYICGEETALLNSLEGKRANPRSRPPFPAVSGVWGRPTTVNNVETLCNVPHIVRNGAKWYNDLGLTADSGTKLFGVSGRVKNPGCWELPMGTPIREIIEEHAGGMQDGFELRGLLPGGGSTDFLVPEHLDLPMDYESIQNAGSRMGTGTMILLDDKTCPVGMIENLIHFFAQESCGFCTPCRDGLPWVEKVLNRIENGEGRPDDMDVLEKQARFIGSIGHTNCAHAPGAVEPLMSGMKYFRDAFDQHISEHECRYR